MPLTWEGSTAVGATQRRGADLRQHHVVRIPPHEAVVLNSKDKVPYWVVFYVWRMWSGEERRGEERGSSYVLPIAVS